MSEQPTTEAGRRLLWQIVGPLTFDGIDRRTPDEAAQIAAIEQEAAATALEAAAERVAGLDYWGVDSTLPEQHMVNRDAALAAIRASKEPA